MTAEQHFDRHLAAWLERETTSVPDDLLARCLARVRDTRQRPGWRAAEGVVLPTRGARLTFVPAWAVVLIALLVVAALAVGASRLLPDLTAVVVEPSPVPTDRPIATELPDPTPAPSAGPLGGRLILAHEHRWDALGPVAVILIDAGSGERTVLGTLPGREFEYNSPPRYTFVRSDVGNEVVVDFGDSLADVTAAGRAFHVQALDVLSASCCADGMYEGISFSPTGDRIAGIRADGDDHPVEVLVEDVDGGNGLHLPVPEGMTGFGVLSWAPDGSALIGVGCRPCNEAETPQGVQTDHHGHLYVVPLDGSSWRELLDVDNGQPNGWFTADGSTIAIAVTTCAAGSFMPRCDPSEDAAWIGTIDVATDHETRLRDADGLTWIRSSPDGSRVVFTARDGTFVLRLADSTEVRLDVPDNVVLEWSPDGRWLLYQQANLLGQPRESTLWIVSADGDSAPRRIATDVYGGTW